MALSDPQSITINSVAISLPRVTVKDSSAAYSSADGLTKLSVSNAYSKRTRRVIRVDVSKIAADPLISAQNIKYNMSTFLVVDVPITGYTNAEAKLVIDGFLTALTASSGALVTKVLGGES